MSLVFTFASSLRHGLLAKAGFRARGWLGLGRVVACVLVTAFACLEDLHGAGTQETSAGEGFPSPETPASIEEGGGFRILGHQPDRRRTYGLMWALHPFWDFPKARWVGGVGVQFSQWIVGTFVNTYRERSWVVGVERNWWRGRSGWLDFGVGYRVGLMTGYDERLFELAGKLPAAPFGGVLVWTQAGPVGLNVFYVYRAITFEASVGF